MACAGAVVRDARGRILLIRRGTEPGRGLWSVPGGRVEPGETTAEAAVRETHEASGFRVVVEGLAGIVERAGPNGEVFVIDDHVGAWRSTPIPSRSEPATMPTRSAWWTPTSSPTCPASSVCSRPSTAWDVLARVTGVEV